MTGNRIKFLDCPLDAISYSQAVDQCLNWCQGQRQAHTVVTINASILMMMRRDKELLQACTAGDLIVADGMSVVWGTNLVGTAVPERIAGVDLMASLLEEAAKQQLKVFFLGATEEVVTRLKDICHDKYPGLMVAGYRNGYFSDDQHAEIIHLIRQSEADLLFVGMPSPFKEVWCEKQRDSLGIPVIMGVGGSFDVLAGYVKRAPVWLQNIGMEWFWRLLKEPRKMWKRYLFTNTLFIWHTLFWAQKKREK